MAIEVLEENTNEVILKFNKGYIEYLEYIVKSWNFKDICSALEFAMSVLHTSRPGLLATFKNNDDYCRLIPTDKLINLPENK